MLHMTRMMRNLVCLVPHKSRNKEMGRKNTPFGSHPLHGKASSFKNPMKEESQYEKCLDWINNFSFAYMQVFGLEDTRTLVRLFLTNINNIVCDKFRLGKSELRVISLFITAKLTLNMYQVIIWQVCIAMPTLVNWNTQVQLLLNQSRLTTNVADLKCTQLFHPKIGKFSMNTRHFNIDSKSGNSIRMLHKFLFALSYAFAFVFPFWFSFSFFKFKEIM